MSRSAAQVITISVSPEQYVSGLLLRSPDTRACFVMAHGAGAGMTHPFLAAIAEELALRGIASLRYQFPFMEKGARRPDPPAIAHATVRAAVLQGSELLPETPLIAGGKSYGGRMTSQAHAAFPLPGVRGLAFLGFPLHPARKPGTERALHLSAVELPMLFLQGTRDALAGPELIKAVAAELGPRATLRMIANADHAFHVPVRTGRNDTQVRDEIIDTLDEWISTLLEG
jgi:uncharacterized protein